MYFPSKLLVLTLIAVLSPMTSAAQDERARIDALRAEGNEALYNLDYEGARKIFPKMLEVAPHHPAGALSMAGSLWFQELNEEWKLKATLYSEDPDEKVKAQLSRAQIEEFRKWIRTCKQLSEARLRKDRRDVEALYFLGAAEGLEAAFAGSVERKYRAALREGMSAVDHHREVLKLAPDFHDAQMTIGLLNYVVGSLPLPVKLLVATMGVRGSKKRGLEAIELVARQGHWARDGARIVLVDLYKREKRWNEAVAISQELAERYPRNYLFKLQQADALVSQIVSAGNKKKPSTGSQPQQQLMNIFTALFNDKTLNQGTIDLVHYRYGEALVALDQPEAAAKEFIMVVNRADADPELKAIARQRLEKIRKVTQKENKKSTGR